LEVAFRFVVLRRAGALRRRVVVLRRVVLRRAGALRRAVVLRRETLRRAMLFTFLLLVRRRFVVFRAGFTITNS